ncbi:MAG: hypothetical protein VX916_07535, partial [Planctomycetota bacterium]|nr:hypothetical protein [Planctomycetota bacterium]
MFTETFGLRRFADRLDVRVPGEGLPRLFLARGEGAFFTFFLLEDVGAFVLTIERLLKWGFRRLFGQTAILGEVF